MESSVWAGLPAGEKWVETGDRKEWGRRGRVWERETRKGTLCGRIRLNVWSGECSPYSIIDSRELLGKDTEIGLAVLKDY